MDDCILCLEKLPKKNRRNIYSDTFFVKKQFNEVLGFVPEQRTHSSPQYTCYRCFNKLNKLCKIEYELENKLSVLKREKCDIINELRPSRNVLLSPAKKVPSVNFGGASSSIQTPRKLTKRVILRTPTPRKNKKVFRDAQQNIKKNSKEKTSRRSADTKQSKGAF
ncbi:uncharacterized protein LOC134262923 isoform X1 [Saccostrea cucullata]|uniref:uncharacterized protein LOC134262923 isoform X1 n=1 Tax=Saccostrea cuccullata TaxID=36930 RepID=UPI002ED41DE1